MSDLHDKARIWAEQWVPRDSIDVAMMETIADLLAENERLAARIQHTQQWYAERWHWMQQWFRTTGKDLPIADQFWSIIANGTPDVNTPPTYQQQINAALHRAEAAEARLKALCEAEPVALKGVGRITGDGWKDTTTIGQVVFVWNAELPEPYAPGQFPRIGNPIWSASTDQYDFVPASAVELRQFVEGEIAAALIPRPSMEGGK